MALVASGHVRDRPFARSIYAISAKGFTGDLRLSDGGRPYILTWRGGLVVGAASASPTDSLPRVALTSGLVNSTQIGDVMRAISAAPHRSQLEIIAEIARLSPEQIITIKNRALAHRAMRVFALPEASFELHDLATLPPEPDVAPLRAHWLIYQGLCAHYSLERLEGEMAAVRDARFRLSPTGTSRSGDFGFQYAAKECLSALEESALTVAEIVERFPKLTRKAALAILYALLATDGVVAGLGGPAPGEAPGPQSTVSSVFRRHASPRSGPPRPVATPPAMPAVAPMENPILRHEELARQSAEVELPPSPSAPPSAPSSPPASAPNSPPASAPRSPPASAARSSVRPAGRTRRPSTGTGGGVRVTMKGRGRGRAGDPTRTAEIRALMTAKLEALDGGADHYRLLDVAADATAGAIRKAYFALAKKLHPDRLRAAEISESPGDAQRLFASINKAFSVLSDGAKRVDYDAELKRGSGGDAEDEDAEAAAMRILGAESHFVRGEIALRRKAYGEARAEFEKAVELNPKEAEHHALLAWATWCDSDDKSAVLSEVKRGLKRAISLSHRSVAAYFYRGKVASALDDIELALDCFNKVLEFEPEHREANLEVRVLRGRLGKQEKKSLFDRLKGR